MHILLAGGTGFIGQHVAQQALERGFELSLLVRRPQAAAALRLQENGAVLVEGDLNDRASLDRAFAVVRPDVYMHSAGWYELGLARARRQAMWNVNVTGLEHALGAAAQAGVERVLLTSSTTAHGDTDDELVAEGFQRRAPPRSWYEQTLVAARQVADRFLARGLPLVIGSPAQVIGPGDHSAYGQLFRLYLRGLLPPLVWAPQGAFSFVHVQDVARALLTLAERADPGQEYFISGSVMTNREMLSTWTRELGRRTHFVWLPYPLALATGAAAAPLLRLFGQPAFISTEVVRSSYVSFRYSSERIQQAFGVRLRSAEQAWQDTIRAERELLAERSG